MSIEILRRNIMVSKVSADNDKYAIQLSIADGDVILKEIKQLKAELDKHRWIPVSEEPIPKDSGQYLVCNMRQGGVKRLINWDTIHHQWGSYGVPISSPQDTHWMPIILPDGE